MVITQITVGYQETCSLPDYCNVRPSVTLTAECDEDEFSGQADLIRARLLATCKKTVQEEINRALEQVYQPCKYFDGPLYKIGVDYAQQIVVLMPDDARTSDHPALDGLLQHEFHFRSSRRLRYEWAREIINKDPSLVPLDFFDCAQGDYDKISDFSREEPSDTGEPF